MDLTQVDGCDPIARDLLGTLIGEVSGTKLVALTIPPDLDLLGLVKTPLDSIGRIVPAVRYCQMLWMGSERILQNYAAFRISPSTNLTPCMTSWTIL